MLSIRCSFPWVYLKNTQYNSKNNPSIWWRFSAPPPAQSPTFGVGLGDTFTLLCLCKRGGDVGEGLGEERQNTHSRGSLGWRARWPSVGRVTRDGVWWRKKNPEILGGVSGLRITRISTDNRCLEAKYSHDGFWGNRDVSCSVHGFSSYCSVSGYRWVTTRNVPWRFLPAK